MSEQARPQLVWLPDGFGGGEHAHVYCATDYDALHAEAEALRVALLGIASVNPSERGIEWAKSYASDGLKGAGSELYARWLDTFKEAEALRAQRNKMAQILRDLVPGCKWRIMRPRIDQALQEVDGGY